MIHVTWIDRGGEPTQPPDPRHPDGVDLDVTRGVRPFCQADLPYPAKRLGYYTIACDVCGFTAMVSTAGRADDPRSIKLPCKLELVTSWR